MELQNGYKLIYDARERSTQQNPCRMSATKTFPSISDGLISVVDEAGNAVDIKTLKLIYSDGTYLYGSTQNIPTKDDIVVILKAANGDVVFGEAHPVESFEVTVNSITNATITGAGTYDAGETATVSITADAGYEFAAAPTATANGEALELTEVEGSYSADITVEEAIAVVFTATVQPVVVSYTVTTNEITNAVITGAGSYNDGADCTVSIAAESGYNFDGTPTATINDAELVLTEDTGVYSATFAVDGDKTVVFTASIK